MCHSTIRQSSVNKNAVWNNFGTKGVGTGHFSHQTLGDALISCSNSDKCASWCSWQSSRVTVCIVHYGRNRHESLCNNSWYKSFFFFGGGVDTVCSFANKTHQFLWRVIRNYVRSIYCQNGHHDSFVSFESTWPASSYQIQVCCRRWLWIGEDRGVAGWHRFFFFFFLGGGWLHLKNLVKQ